MASKSYNLAKSAFAKLRVLYPTIGKNVNSGADTVPSVMLAQFARGLMAADGTIITSADGGGILAGQGVGGAVTQITSSSTGVTLSKAAGRITTVALTTAAGAEEVFTVTCTAIKAADTISFGTTYAGAGTPMISSKKIIDATSFDVVITNLHATAAFDALIIVNFAIVRGAAS